MSSRFGTQGDQDFLQCSAQGLPVDAFAFCNLRQRQTVDPEGADPSAVIRLQRFQCSAQPFALWISLLASVIWKTADPGLWLRGPIVVAELMIQ